MTATKPVDNEGGKQNDEE